MKGKWFRYYKEVQGRLSAEEYKFLEEEKDGWIYNKGEEFHLRVVEYWASDVNKDGSNYGFAYGFEDIESPPQEWIDKKILSTEKEIQSKMDYVTFLKTVNQVK